MHNILWLYGHPMYVFEVKTRGIRVYQRRKLRGIRPVRFWACVQGI